MVLIKEFWRPGISSLLLARSSSIGKIFKGQILESYLPSFVALCGSAAKADESVLARNQTKDSWT